jgi:hypothetical protein
MCGEPQTLSGNHKYISRVNEITKHFQLLFVSIFMLTNVLVYLVISEVSYTLEILERGHTQVLSICG